MEELADPVTDSGTHTKKKGMTEKATTKASDRKSVV